MLRQLPNALTVLRLLLALPLALLLLERDHPAALVVVAIAGITDALDGFLARRLDARTQLGALLDPVADKTLVTVSFLCFAATALIPWWVALAILARDLVIVAGALSYRLLVGPFEFAARTLSKINMAVQMAFCVLLLAAQLSAGLPAGVAAAATAVVLLIALVSGLDYVVAWGRRALAERRGGAP